MDARPLDELGEPDGHIRDHDPRMHELYEPYWDEGNYIWISTIRFYKPDLLKLLGKGSKDFAWTNEEVG